MVSQQYFTVHYNSLTFPSMKTLLALRVYIVYIMSHGLRSVAHKHFGIVSCLLLCIVLLFVIRFFLTCPVFHCTSCSDLFFINDSLFSAWFNSSSVSRPLPNYAWGQTFTSLMVFEGNKNENEPLFFQSSTKAIGKARQKKLSWGAKRFAMTFSVFSNITREKIQKLFKEY